LIGLSAEYRKVKYVFTSDLTKKTEPGVSADAEAYMVVTKLSPMPNESLS